ncbi:family 78 glycoside hydrolase catalytic domain [Paenibacillus oryzisoli]|uniref:family 78 glycoside hydrolase catalytic domain n=1 Tax=Paenibacillus oryzisoli TaxID=1850517 RepID=UPI003D2E73FF
MTVSVTACKTEYLMNPLGLDCLEPRFFWQLEADRRNVRQSTYQIVVASTKEDLELDRGDQWDSGKIDSDDSIQVVYAGKALQSEKLYFWKVRVWDEQGQVSAWSEPAFWSMGILSRSEWKGKWIGRKAKPELNMQPSPFLRKEFSVRSDIRRAMVYVTALGLFQLKVNGQPVGHLFAPGWTDYDKRVQVHAYEVTEQLTQGANAFGVILGDGWYAGTVGFLGRHVYGERPFFLMQACLEYEDGSREIVTTDATWRTTEGPIRYSDLIKGEIYDARLELTGWDRAGYDDSDWETPDIRSGYNGLLVAAVEPPIRIMKTMKPITVRRTEAGSYIFDMGQNMVGWTEVNVQGAAGTQITLSHAEMLNPDGSLYLDNLRVAVQQDHYILKGDGEEKYEPHFTFHGFRYVEVIGYPGEPDLTAITGKVIHSDTPVAGALETSDGMVNQLYANITWGQRGNFLSVPTDCPQRDERLGWTGDAQIFARTASYNMDVSRFFTKYMQDIIDCQQPSGAFTDVAPDAGWIRHKMWNTRLNWFAPDNAGWGDAGVIIPWTLYTMYGDKRILQTHYDAMVRWVDYLTSSTDNLIRPNYANYGDWLSIEADTPNEVLATAYFAYSTKLLSKIAGAIGRVEDQLLYETHFTNIAKAFCERFVRSDGRIHGETQTGYVLALHFGLLTPELKTLAIRHLTNNIRARGDRLSTGFLGVGYLLPALMESGESDVAYTLLTQKAFPSWMYSILHGATTIWERWDGWTEDKGFQTPSMNSFNHYSLGSVGEWMFRYMAGIEADSSVPGFRHSFIRPQPGGDLKHVKASYASLYGRIAVEWSLIEAGELTLIVEIPANTTASVLVPARNISIDGVKAGEGDAAIPVLEQTEGTQVKLGSGTYTFTGRAVNKQSEGQQSVGYLT